MMSRMGQKSSINSLFSIPLAFVYPLDSRFSWQKIGVKFIFCTLMIAFFLMLTSLKPQLKTVGVTLPAPKDRSPAPTIPGPTQNLHIVSGAYERKQIPRYS